MNRVTLDKAAAKHPGARKEVDFRKLFDHASEFDAVVVSTCEHTHAFATLPALQLGKHVYCEKPLTHNVWEAAHHPRGRREGQGRHADGHADPRRRQLPPRRRADPDRRDRPGARGPRLGRPRLGPAVAEGRRDEQGHRLRDASGPPRRSPVPPGLDWDLWLGPAPARPFHAVYVPGPKWYRWWDFGNGTMSDLGSHWNDLPFWALKLDAPLTIEATGPPPHPEIAPASMQRDLRVRPARRHAAGRS